MKRILTLIVTLVCVFSAYSQNTVYIWKDNTLSVQAADSIAFCEDGYVDLGLSVIWKNCAGTELGGHGVGIYEWSDDMAGYIKGETGRMPSVAECKELYDRCTHREYTSTGKYGNHRKYIEFTGPNGNRIYLIGFIEHYYMEGGSWNYIYRYWTREKNRYVDYGPDSFSSGYGANTVCALGYVAD